MSEGPSGVERKNIYPSSGMCCSAWVTGTVGCSWLRVPVAPLCELEDDGCEGGICDWVCCGSDGAARGSELLLLCTELRGKATLPRTGVPARDFTLLVLTPDREPECELLKRQQDTCIKKRHLRILLLQQNYLHTRITMMIVPGNEQLNNEFNFSNQYILTTHTFRTEWNLVLVSTPYWILFSFQLQIQAFPKWVSNVTTIEKWTYSNVPSIFSFPSPKPSSHIDSSSIRDVTVTLVNRLLPPRKLLWGWGRRKKT